MKGILTVIAFLGVVYFVAAPAKKDTAAPPAVAELTADEKAKQAAAEKQKEQEDAAWRREILAIRSLRQAMKNPDSFNLEEAVRMADGVLCLTYRATNSFNAIVPGRAVIRDTKINTSDEGDKFTPTWNRYCGGKSGKDVSYIRRAI